MSGAHGYASDSRRLQAQPGRATGTLPVCPGCGAAVDARGRCCKRDRAQLSTRPAGALLAHGGPRAGGAFARGSWPGVGALVAFLVALVSGCASGDKPLVGYIGPGLSDGCVASIHAANEWYAEQLGASPLELRVTDVEPAAADYREVVFRHREMKNWAGYAVWEHDRAGRVHHGAISLRAGCGLRAVAHELGHVFGLPHEGDVNNVMADANGPEMLLTEAQLEQVGRALEMP